MCRAAPPPSHKRTAVVWAATGCTRPPRGARRPGPHPSADSPPRAPKSDRSPPRSNHCLGERRRRIDRGRAALPPRAGTLAFRETGAEPATPSANIDSFHYK